MPEDLRIPEPFLCAPGLKIEAHERLVAVQFAQLVQQLGKIEETVERLERRLWLAVYGVVAAVLAQAFLSFLPVTP